MQQLSPEKHYLNTIYQEEKQKAIELLGGNSKTQPPAQDAIAELYADISGRLAVIEQYLLTIEEKPQKAFKKSKLYSKHNTLSTNELHIAIADMEQFPLGKLEYSNQEIPFRTVTADSSIICDLNISRLETMALTIDIESVSDINILKKSQIKIDGVLLEHKVAKIKGQLRLHCRIPASENDDVTHLELKVPPNAESDKYHLAISDIHCIPKPSLRARLTKLIIRR